MRDNWKSIAYGVTASLLVLVLAAGVYWSYSLYQQHRTLWSWAGGTQNWVNATDATVKDLALTLRKLAGNANIKSMLLQQTRLDKIEARLDKLESPPHTEAEKSEGEGE